ncbi:piggyBac transposable element-derived protein 4 isoform X2 [Pieris rapae]|uniref:piggyBac transposable element-derived protein 4 isoform X2 n=1 Tax=Pieris rapae TaxID=64459 RepID=UPI001E28156E|nr:piggyBac transposable element-derived protein 4 isoform X2 [Pieris rapae]
MSSPSQIDNSEYHGDGEPTHAGSRSRGRGGRVGRGGRGSRGDRGGRGNSGETVYETRSDLDVVRAQRQVAKRRVAALSAEARKELLSRMREEQLTRVLLPDAPPRKGPVQRPSPVRESCELIDSESGNDSNIIVSLENRQMAPPPTQDNTGDVHIRSDIEPETEVEISVAPSTSKQHTFIGVSDKNLTAQTIEEWMTDDLSDCDIEIEDEICPLILPSRNALTEPAILNDLTPYEAGILETEDQQNDLVLRDFVPSDCFDFNWTRDRQIFTGQRETFTGTGGPTFRISDTTRIIDIFYKMIDNDFIDKLCTETNRYANQKIKSLKKENKFLPTSRLYRWSPTDRDEMVSFLAVIILQGLFPLPEEESYFVFNSFGTMPYFRRIMTYNRYILIKSMLHFVDNETMKKPTALFKIQPIIDYFNDKFSSLYYPSQEIVIDESLLKWHGRLGFAQKILSKAAKVGVKTYELCESSSGYLWKFFVYVGKEKTRTVTTNDVRPDEDQTADKPSASNEKDNNRPNNIDDTNDKTDDAEITDQTSTGNINNRPSNATSKIVYDLVEPLLHRGHTLIMDNFYNCPLLARCLKRQNTDCYGTLRLNREFVPDLLKTLTKTELRQGEVVATYCSDLSICVWRDANIVSLISTYHYLQIGSRQKHNRLTFKPSIVLDYNKTMGGVDRKDQFLSAHPVERTKNKIWYKKLFRRMLNAALFNSFVIFKSANPKISHRQFRTILAEDLLKIHRHIDLTTEPRLIASRAGLTLTKRPRPTTINRPRLEQRHFPVRNGHKKARCWMCAQRKVAARTIWKCLECNINLCIEGCFMEYHI